VYHAGGKVDVSVSSLNVDFELLNQSPSQIERLPHNHYQGFTFADPSLVKRYLKLELYILIHFRVGRIDDEFLALFHKQRFSPTDPQVGSVVKDASGPQMLTEIELPHCGPSSQQQTMFVSDIEIMESPKIVVPSLVWFDTFDDVNRFLPHSLYLSRKRGLFIFGGRNVFKDRKSGGFGNSSVVDSNEMADQIVESTPDVLENVTSDKQNFRRDRRDLDRIVDVLSGIRISLFSDHVWITGYECIESGMQLLDVLVGPVDL
jgi:hypothetical protein